MYNVPCLQSSATVNLNNSPLPPPPPPPPPSQILQKGAQHGLISSCLTGCMRMVKNSEQLTYIVEDSTHHYKLYSYYWRQLTVVFAAPNANLGSTHIRMTYSTFVGGEVEASVRAQQ